MARTRPPRSHNPKLLAVDLDGTLLDPTSGKPHPRDLAALHALAATGVTVSIATGRLYSGTRATASALGLRGPVACVDGSHIVHAGDHSTLLHHGIVGAAAVKLRDALIRSHSAVFAFADDAIVHDAHGREFVDYLATWSTDVRLTESVGDHACWIGEVGVTAAVVIGAGGRVSRAAEEIRRELGESVAVVTYPLRHRPGGMGMIVRAAGRTKGSALAWLAAHHGLDLAETVCVGDWLNDVPMLEVAGLSYAMGHAPDDVKRAATNVLVETSEHGGGIARIVGEAFEVWP